MVNGQLVEYRSLVKNYTGREAGAVYRVARNDLDEKLVVGLVSPGGLFARLEMVVVTGEVFASFVRGKAGVGVGFNEGGFNFANAVVALPPTSIYGETDLVVSINANERVESYVLAEDRAGERVFLHEAEAQMTKKKNVFITTSEVDLIHRREMIRRYNSFSELRGNKGAVLYQVGVRRLMGEVDAVDLWAHRLGEMVSWRVSREFTFFGTEMTSLFEIDLDHLPGAIDRLFSNLGEEATA